jgi:hypothetical protein
MRSGFLLCALFLGFTAIPGFAQLPSQNPASNQPTMPDAQQQQPRDPNSPFPGDDDENHSRMMRDMEKKAAKERVAALKNDTDKLLKLSTELKAYVDKTDENVLSLDVVKKAEEIEKLAKSVKEKMKGPN